MTRRAQTSVLADSIDGERRLVFLGDSLTDGSFYPDIVVNTLNRLFPGAPFSLLNAGVCGDTAADLLARCDADVRRRGAELAIVAIGTNDCGERRPPAQFESDLERLVLEIRDGAAKVVLLRPSPRIGPAARVAPFADYLQAIDRVAARLDVPLADACGLFQQALAEGRSVLLSDGVHHEIAGFTLYARAVLDALGFPDAPLDTDLRPDPGLLLSWERSAPVADWRPGDSLPGPEAARDWRPDDGAAALAGPDVGFARRGAWLACTDGRLDAAPLVFGRTGFDAPADGAVELQLGGSHPLVVWLNGREVWRSTRRHGYHAQADLLDVPVVKGRNELVALSRYMVFAGVKPIGATTEIDGYRIFRRALASPPHQREDLALRDRLNAEFMAAAPPPAPSRWLSGSFIYAHAAGYRSRCTLAYRAAEWRGLFRELKELGMDTAILGAAAWVDLEECYYPSELFKSFRAWNVLDPMLDAARGEGMRIFLGAAGMLGCERMIGGECGDTRMAAACAARELACYRELVARYRGAFHGYYLSSETGFWNWGNADYLTRCFHAYFERVTHGVKELTPEAEIIGSPYTVRCRGREAQALETLAAVHGGCPFTALAPQDSIGVSMNDLPFLETGLRIWRDVCRAIGAAFWVNCETFNIEDFNGPQTRIVPADYARLGHQLDVASRMGAEKLVTWEAIHFMNPRGSSAARRLRADYLRHRPKGRAADSAGMHQ